MCIYIYVYMYMDIHVIYIYTYVYIYIYVLNALFNKSWPLMSTLALPSHPESEINTEAPDPRTVGASIITHKREYIETAWLPL